MHRLPCRPQHLQRRRFHVNNERLQLRRPQCLYCLVVRTHDTNTSRVHDATHTLRRRAIQMSLVFAVLYELARLNVLLHLLTCNEQVFSPRYLSRANVPSSVCKILLSPLIIININKVVVTYKELDCDTFRDLWQWGVASTHFVRPQGHRSVSRVCRFPVEDTVWPPPRTWRSFPDQSHPSLLNRTWSF